MSSLVSNEGSRIIPFSNSFKEKEPSNVYKSKRRETQEESGEGRKQREADSNNWVLSAFATLKRPNSTKKNPAPPIPSLKRPAPQPNPQRHLDMQSPIPTGHDSLLGEREGWRARSEKSFFTKQDLAHKHRNEMHDELEKNNTENANIKVKSEINVRRQLFPNNMEEHSNISENAKPQEDPKPLSVFNPLHDLKSPEDQPDKGEDKTSIDLTTPATLNGEAKKQESLSSSKPSSPLRYNSMKLPLKNEFQLWKRMSLTLRDKNANSNSQESEEQKTSLAQQEENDKEAYLENEENFKISPFKEDAISPNKIKTKTGLSAIPLKDLFLQVKFLQMF